MPQAASKPFLDPAALLRIGSLELRARMVMEGFWKGLHRSRRHGFSAEFSEYRPYVRGDDPRFMDWKVAARSDRWFVKKFDEETNLRCQIVLDASPSMSYGSGDHPKGEYAATLAATLALFLMDQGDAVGLTLFDEAVQDHLPARRRAGQLHALLTHLQRAVELRKTQPGRRRAGVAFADALGAVSPLLRRRALLVVISDFLAPLEGLDTRLGLFGAMGHEVALAQILDPAELEFPFERPGAFEDLESGRRLVLDPRRARESYLARLRTHLESLRSISGRTNTTHHLVRSDAPLERFLFEFVSSRRRVAGPLRARRRSSTTAAA